MPTVNRPGTFVRIPLADGSFGYGRAIQLPFYAFYQYSSLTPESDLEAIASSPILFRISIRHKRRSPWEFIGWRELEEVLTQPIVEYKQDKVDPRRCTIFDTAGNKRPASPEECVGLELWSVWEEHGAEERLLDALLGRPNATLEHRKARLMGKS